MHFVSTLADVRSCNRSLSAAVVLLLGLSYNGKIILFPLFLVGDSSWFHQQFTGLPFLDKLRTESDISEFEFISVENLREDLVVVSLELISNTICEYEAMEA
jgi:hypothetical protein